MRYDVSFKDLMQKGPLYKISPPQFLMSKVKFKVNQAKRMSHEVLPCSFHVPEQCTISLSSESNVASRMRPTQV